MNRRTFIGTSAVAGAGIAAMGINCGGKSVSGTVTMLMGAVAELKILFQSQQATLDKVVNLAKSFNDAWVAGKFADARTFFENLDSLVGQVITDLGLNASTRVKLILATLGIAVRAIAALIKEQGEASNAAALAGTATTNRVNQLADSATADRLLKASKP